MYGALATARVLVKTTPAQEPAAPIKRLIRPDYLVCLEDGAKMKVLTRYLKRRFGLTPETYRAKYRAKWAAAAGLPDGSARQCR